MTDGLLLAQNSVALLPPLLWQQWGLSLSWSVVAAGFGAWLVGCWSSRKRVQVAAATGLAIWALLPGPLGGTYWLGLAFQAPSVTTVLLSAFLCCRALLKPAQPVLLHKTWSPEMLFLAMCGVILGWVLLLDTLGVFRSSFYNRGFGAIAPAIALGIAASPWILAKNPVPHQSVVLAAFTILLFLVLRLPTGNLFDALIDPGLWCFLQVALFQHWRQRSKPASA